MFNNKIETPTMLFITFISNFYTLLLTSVFLGITFSNTFLIGCLVVSLTISLIVVLSKYISNFFHIIITSFNMFSIVNMSIIVYKNNHGHMTGINGFINYLTLFLIGVIIATIIESINVNIQSKKLIIN